MDFDIFRKMSQIPSFEILISRDNPYSPCFRVEVYAHGLTILGPLEEWLTCAIDIFGEGEFYFRATYA